MSRRPLFAAVLVACILLPASAFAQASGALPPVSLPIAVTTIVSLLLGVLNMALQGSILNLVTVPKTWAAPLTAAVTFLTGAGTFLGTASQPWTGSTAFYALAYGLAGLFGASVPAFLVHGHATLPKMIRGVRLRLPPAGPALVLVGALLGAGAIASTEAACTPAQQVTISEVDQKIANDLAAGKTVEEIKQDVNAILGKPGIDLETIVMDGITLVLDLGILPLAKVEPAEKMRDDLRVKKGLPVPTHLLRAAP